MIKEIKLEDAAAMHALHKYTFELPTNDQLGRLAIDDFVKVCANGERFWCKIVSLEKGEIIGQVDNELIQDELRLNDLIKIKANNIYSVLK